MGTMNDQIGTLTAMVNSLMADSAQQAPVPNITGWPPARERSAPIPQQEGLGVTAAATNQAAIYTAPTAPAIVAAAPPGLQTIAFQSPNHYSTQVPLPAVYPTPHHLVTTTGPLQTLSAPTANSAPANALPPANPPPAVSQPAPGSLTDRSTRSRKDKTLGNAGYGNSQAPAGPKGDADDSDDSDDGDYSRASANTRSRG